MYNKRGFTLIELLAVIVILAIISLIVAPIILNIINDTRETSDKRSIELFIHSLQNKIIEKNLDTAFNPSLCQIENSEVICDEINIGIISDGEPITGIVELENGKISYYDLTINKKNYVLDISSDCLISLNPGKIDLYVCNYKNIKIPDNLKLGTRTVTSFSFNDSKCREFEKYFSDIIPGETCESLKTSLQNITSEELFNTVYKVFYDITFSEESNEKYDVDTISSVAFAANNLKSILLGEGIKYIKYGAFAYNAITNLSLSPTIIELGENSFNNNYISSIDFSKATNLEEIKRRAFFVNSLESISIKGLPKLKIIDNAAFAFNYLSSVDIGDSVNFIGEDAFNCNNIKNVIIGSGIETIEQNAFSAGGCANFVDRREYGSNKIEYVKINTLKDNVNFNYYDGNSIFGFIDDCIFLDVNDEKSNTCISFKK